MVPFLCLIHVFVLFVSIYQILWNDNNNNYRIYTHHGCMSSLILDYEKILYKFQYFFLFCMLHVHILRKCIAYHPTQNNVAYLLIKKVYFDQTNTYQSYTCTIDVHCKQDFLIKWNIFTYMYHYLFEFNISLYIYMYVCFEKVLPLLLQMNAKL